MMNSIPDKTYDLYFQDDDLPVETGALRPATSGVGQTEKAPTYEDLHPNTPLHRQRRDPYDR